MEKLRAGAEHAGVWSGLELERSGVEWLKAEQLETWSGMKQLRARAEWAGSLDCVEQLRAVTDWAGSIEQLRSRGEWDSFNLVAVAILSRGKCGLSTCTSRYLVAMATADLLVIITDVILYQIHYYYFPRSFLDVTPVCSAVFVLISASTDCSVWFTVIFSLDRFVAICCQKFKFKYCTEKTALLVILTTCILFCLRNIPFYFVYEPGEIIDNVPWFCYDIPNYFTNPAWVGFDWFHKVFNPLFPFILIIMFNSLTVRYILVTSQTRKRLKGQNKVDICKDPEIESRRKSMILLFTISGSFILLWLTNVLDFLYYNITDTDPNNYNDSLYIFRQIGFLLRDLSCCTNTFIYGVTQSKFRRQFKSAVKYAVTSFLPTVDKTNRAVFSLHGTQSFSSGRI
ncbi:probable G-protein coupled receptor 139 [Chiloscyllium punctatum]|uniref:probable G-protein coupled receptor 139 n=1 Tax=Chiloscyllium punctatum TaxID=137246 RepID=UPI003B639ED3